MQARNISPFLIVSTLSLLLAGCADIPRLGDLLPMRSLSSFETARTVDNGHSEWPTDQWWLAYHDDQLNALINESFEKSPSIEQAVARVKQTQAIEEQFTATLYPSIIGNATVEKTKQSYNNGVPSAFVPHGFKDFGRATLDINYQLDFWGKNHDNLAAAISARKAADLQASEARLTLATAIGEAYGQLIQLYGQLDTANDALDIRSKTTNLFKDRLANGLETQGIYDEQLAAKASAEANIEEINESIALAKNKLAALAGAGPDRALTIARPKIANLQNSGLPENVPAELIGRRPDILAAKFVTMAAAKRIDAAKADFYPNINLAASFGQQSLGLDLFTKHGSFIGSFGPALSLPIFEGGRLRGVYKESAAEYEMAVSQYNATIVKALNEIADAAVSQKALIARTQKIKQAVSASEKAHEAALARYKGGLATYLDVLRSEDSLIANRSALADIKTRKFILDVQMVRALGGGFYDPDYK